MKLFRLIKVSKTKDGNETKSVVTEACDMKTLQVLINSCKGEEDCTFEWEEVVLKAEAPKEEKKSEEKKAKKEEAEDDEDEEDEESGLMEKIKTGAKYALVGGIGVGAGWLAHDIFGKKKDND